MSLAQATKNLKLDSRLIEKNVASGELSKEDLQKHLANLPDSANNAETFTIDGKSSDDETH